MLQDKADEIDEEALLHMLHLGGNPLIRTIRIRPPSLKCLACGPDANIKVDEFDYETFCSGPADVGRQEGLEVGDPNERIGVKVSSIIFDTTSVD
jgi:adenylyltransferase/sulfurtransferase